MSELITAAIALFHGDPQFIENLSDAERAILPYLHDLWLRPEQKIPRYPWAYYGFLGGRGFGKTAAIPVDINERVETGEIRSLGLMAPTELRVVQVQHKALIETAKPWFRPVAKGEDLIWPNGAVAHMFTPLAPGRPRSENLDATWLTEIVDWQHTTRREAFNNITTATRQGPAQVYWDTTSRGKNEVIELLLNMHASDPRAFPVIRGSTFDNPILTARYLQTETQKYAGREFEEEIMGFDFTEAAGALFMQAWLDDHRVLRAPREGDVDLRIVSVDPALSDGNTADLFGFIVSSRTTNAHVYIEQDLSERYRPEQWGDLVVEQCATNGASGAIIERNHAGDNPTYVIRSRAALQGMTVRVLDRDKPFPPRTPGVIYVRELVSATGKTARATGPAAETQAGKVHLVGTMPGLEHELTSYEPGTSRSPNRYDAFTQAVSELRGLLRETRDAKQEMAAATAARDVLATALRGRRGRRGIGL